MVPDYVTLKGLAFAAGTDTETLADLNPALTREVVAGKLHVPKGYRLRVPPGGAVSFSARYASVAATQKYVRQRSVYVTHRVKKGQTLVAIAKHYGTTVAAIQRRNNLRGAARVKPGQRLIIPTA